MHKPSLLDRLVKFFDRWFDNMDKKYKGREFETQEGSEELRKAVDDINESLGFSDEVNNPCRFL